MQSDGSQPSICGRTFGKVLSITSRICCQPSCRRRAGSFSYHYSEEKNPEGGRPGADAASRQGSLSPENRQYLVPLLREREIKVDIAFIYLSEEKKDYAVIEQKMQSLLAQIAEKTVVANSTTV